MNALTNRPSSPEGGGGRFLPRRRDLSALILCLVIFSLPAMAHKVNMFAYVEGGQIFLEGYFADGKKALNSEVKLFDAQDKLLWQGRTDAQGEATIPLPATDGDLRITLNASMGHKTEYILTADEIRGVEDGSTVAATSAVSDNEATNSEAAPAIDNRQLKRIVRREVGVAIKPLVRGLSELKERRGISDIVGGIGIIAGLLGAWFFVQARKLQQPTGKKA